VSVRAWTLIFTTGLAHLIFRDFIVSYRDALDRFRVRLNSILLLENFLQVKFWVRQVSSCQNATGFCEVANYWVSFNQSSML